MALDFPRQISFILSTMKLIPPSQLEVSSKAAMFLAQDTQSRVNRSASKVGWGGVAGNLGQKMSKRVSIAKAVVSREYQCSGRGAYLCNQKVQL